MSNLRDRGTFETAYAGKAPWDIGKPQGAIAESVDLVTSPVLDAGCDGIVPISRLAGPCFACSPASFIAPCSAVLAQPPGSAQPAITPEWSGIRKLFLIRLELPLKTSSGNSGKK